MRISIDLASPSRLSGPVGQRRVVVGGEGPVLKLTGKDRAVQLRALSDPGDWVVGMPPSLGPYERMTLVRLCVALESVAGSRTEHQLGDEFEEDLEAVRSRPWPGAISDVGLVL